MYDELLESRKPALDDDDDDEDYAPSARTVALHGVKPQTTIYDALHDKVYSALSKPASRMKFLNDIEYIKDSNSKALLTNIVGEQVYINSRDETMILADINLDAATVKDAYDSSEYYRVKSAKKMEKQMLFGLPLVIAIGVFTALKREDDARTVYFFAMLKPYSSVCSQSFQNGVQEDIMLKVIEGPDISMRFDIKKLGDVRRVLENKAAIRYENYKDILAGSMTDKEMDDIFCSGIYTATATFEWKIASKYYDYIKNGKDNNKYLSFERSYSTAVDSDGNSSTVERSIDSNSAAIASYVHSASMKYSVSPINDKFITIAARSGFKTGTDLHVSNIVRTVVSDVDTKRPELVPELFECLLGAFLYKTNPATGAKYMPDDISTIQFIKESTDIINADSGTKDANKLEAKRIVADMTKSSSLQYKNTQSKQIEKSLLMYYSLFVMSAKKNGYGGD